MKAIMRRKEMLAAVGLCYTRIYNMEKKGMFPKRRKLGVRAVGWIKAEVDAWVANFNVRTLRNNQCKHYLSTAQALPKLVGLCLRWKKESLIPANYKEPHNG